MYSFFILCKNGSEQDDFQKSGQSHMLEHFVILSMLRGMFGEIGENINLRGQTSYCYSLLSWRQKEYQKGKELISRFLPFVQNELIVKQHKYRDLVSIARNEVLEEISKRPQDFFSAQTDMIRNLSGGRILSLPIGTAADVGRISEEELFDALRRVYRKDNLEYFAFDYFSDKFVWATMEGTERTNFHEKLKRYDIRDTEGGFLKGNISLNHKYIFEDRKIRIAVPHSSCHTDLAEGKFLTDFLPAAVCRYLNQMWSVEQGFQYHPIYFRTAYGIERINLFQPNKPLIQPCRGVLERSSIPREELYNHFCSVVDFPALKKEYQEHIRLENSVYATRMDCEYAIIHFYGNPYIKLNREISDDVRASDEVLEKGKRCFIKGIDQIQFFH